MLLLVIQMLLVFPLVQAKLQSKINLCFQLRNSLSFHGLLQATSDSALFKGYRFVSASSPLNCIINPDKFSTLFQLLLCNLVELFTYFVHSSLHPSLVGITHQVEVHCFGCVKKKKKKQDWTQDNYCVNHSRAYLERTPIFVFTLISFHNTLFIYPYSSSNHPVFLV